MISIPTKVRERLIHGLKKFQPVLQKAKDKDINESDTVTIISDMLNEVFGYDKYGEITSEYVIKKTFCDLAIEINKKVVLLIEVKATGLALKEDYIRQAVDYGSNSGVDWIVLTNGVSWRIYRIIFSKPINNELIYEFNFLDLSAKKQADLEMLYYISRESVAKASGTLLSELAEQRQVMNNAFIGQLLLTDTILDSIRKNLKKIAPELKITNEEIYDLLSNDVIKRDVFEGEKSEDAKRRIKKYEKSLLKARSEN